MHTRNDTGEVFYVGKGTGKRAWQVNPARRSKHWTRVARKHGFSVHILSRWRTESEAMEHEKFLIRTLNELDLPLVNKTEGGDGTSGFKWSAESKEKLSKALKGKPKTDQHKASLSKPRTITDAVIAAREKRRGRLVPESEREKFLNAIKAKRVVCRELQSEFRTAYDAARWLQKNGKPKAQPGAIHRSCKQGCSAYGYNWIYKE